MLLFGQVQLITQPFSEQAIEDQEYLVDDSDGSELPLLLLGDEDRSELKETPNLVEVVRINHEAVERICQDAPPLRIAFSFTLLYVIALSLTLFTVTTFSFALMYIVNLSLDLFCVALLCVVILS